LHKQDFKEIFALISNLPVNIRLFDPPLHEFLAFDDIRQIAQSLEIDLSVLENKLEDVHEKNPMLGHRGCRLGITMPELYMMQVRAILEAAVESFSTGEQNFQLEIMLPFIADKKELEILLDQIKLSAAKVERAYGRAVKYKIGIMIELPRAALLADTLAPMVDYFSFGTNDLTQMTYGLSRDDMTSFAGAYKDQAIFDKNPFVTIDKHGVGQLIQMAYEKGKNANKALSLSVCGEHGGDPSSIEFFNAVGLNYVSCSPFRIIIAKLAAAQANL
jgi:pyruvate,orthophosphate dikinase